MAISQHLCYIWKLKLPISGNPGSHLNCTGLWTTLCATHLNGLKSQWIAHNMHYFLKTHHYGTKQSGAGKCSAYVICVWRACSRWHTKCVLNILWECKCNASFPHHVLVWTSPRFYLHGHVDLGRKGRKRLPNIVGCLCL